MLRSKLNALLLTAITLAACGGNDPSDPADPAPAKTDAGSGNTQDAAPNEADGGLPDTGEPTGEGGLHEPDAAPDATPDAEPEGCPSGFADCDGDPSNGCEAALDSTSNCGGCGVACAGEQQCINAICQLTCAAPMGDCDSDPANGCETDLSASPDHCSACGNACPAINGTPSCTASTCAIACDAAWADCDADPSNGCETGVASDVGNCGACGHQCPSGANATATCANATCGIACAGGWGDCDTVASNGCEVDLTTSLGNCGACNAACPSLAHATSACSSGSCEFVCEAGWNDCNAVGGDGCEANLLSDVANCGGCGQSCGTANGAASCSGGACSITCHAGFADCDGVNANGCEVDLMADKLNCGTCGHDCRGGTCNNGMCAAWELATTPGQAMIRLATSDQHVYWTGFGRISRVSKTGGAPEVISEGQNYVGISTDAKDVYWTVIAVSGGSVGRVPLSGGTPKVIAVNVDTPYDIRTTDTSVFWLHESGVKITPKVGIGFITDVATTTATPIALEVEGGSVYYITEGLSSGAVVRAFTGGSINPKQLAVELKEPFDLALDSTDVYFTERGGNRVVRVGKGGGVSEVVALGPGPTGVEVDAEHILFATAEGIVQTPKGNPAGFVMRKAGASNPTHLVMDDGVVYWIEAGSNKLFAMVK